MPSERGKESGNALRTVDARFETGPAKLHYIFSTLDDVLGLNLHTKLLICPL